MLKAFSLIELILVVLLLGVVYALIGGTNLISTQTNANNHLKPKVWLKADDKKLLVYDRCSKIVRYKKDGEKIFEDLAKPLSIKVFDQYLNTVAYSDIFLDSDLYDVCLQLEKNPNGTIKSLVLDIENSLYFIGTFEDEIRRYSKIEDIRSSISYDEYLPVSRESYYHE